MPEPTLNTWTIIFLLAAVQGIFLAIAILSQQSKIKKANVFLGTLVLLFSLMLLDYFTFWSNYRLYFPRVFGFSFGFPFFFGPVLFLYIKVLNSKELNFKKEIFHFIPGLIFYLNRMIFFVLPDSVKLEPFALTEPQSLVNFLLMPSLKIVHMLIYSGLIISFIQRTRRGESSRFYWWQQFISGLFILFIISTSSYYILVSTIDFKVEYDYMISLTMAFAIYAIGYLGYKHPEIIHGFKLGQVKYETSSLRADEIDGLLNDLKVLMEEKKHYRNSELKLSDVSEMVGLTTHKLSQLVNEHLNKTFPDFINSYRIEEAKRKLRDPNENETKILAILFDVGFNNKANFNNAFKKFTGMSPSDYKKLHQVEFVN
ncbi:MAG: AraC family transcriptional regulator [Cyclobacteriaceae bacterium]